jgi:hypothetical protein
VIGAAEAVATDVVGAADVVGDADGARDVEPDDEHPAQSESASTKRRGRARATGRVLAITGESSISASVSENSVSESRSYITLVSRRVSHVNIGAAEVAGR